MRAHVFAAIAFAAVSLLARPVVPEATAEPQSGQRARERDNMRFRAMDTNNDGRITRAEWRGNTRAFRNNDWNGDGVLSGAEVRPGASRNEKWQDEPDVDRRDRFDALDANGNGRIERREWNGTRDAFDWLDRNDDGWLSRAETVDNDGDDDDMRDTTFESLDSDRSGAIEIGEWRGARRNFERRDRNGDGRLTRRELGDLETTDTGARRGDQGSAAFGREQLVVVDPRVRWTDTGIDVRAGETLQLQAEGSVVLSGTANGNDRASVSGSTSGRRADNAPLRSLPAGALIARIGNGAPFYVGNQETIDRVNASGRLYLGVNDDDLGDNHGEFRVRFRTGR